MPQPWELLIVCEKPSVASRVWAAIDQNQPEGQRSLYGTNHGTWSYQRWQHLNVHGWEGYYNCAITSTFGQLRQLRFDVGGKLEATACFDATVRDYASKIHCVVLMQKSMEEILCGLLNMQEVLVATRWSSL
eukprot:TRINITY_DN39160_c0_g1_i1.p1 TRINITY_DN39160_c0_g1~~TRINITY_DN39160_c0_g1_i1.p1  ORF type:complete len:132 (-),score=18.05 TRINITY_DN39160_c0_g1_i1:57-452(-)